MKGPVDRLAMFVDALLRERRPPRFPAEPGEAPALYAASALKAARPGADLPRATFIAALERQLSVEVAHADSLPASARRWSRRTLLQVSGASAAAMVAGVLVDRALTADRPPLPTTLVADKGRWLPIVSTAALHPGQAVRFSTGAVEGFVINDAGAVRAMSAVCTHMGCILKFNQDQQRLDCPCHGASFNLDGSPMSRAYLSSLPQLRSRLRDGHVEVEVPAQA
ncbi:MAG TPA: Rieske 2Fe-2S domain-containing protein [Candidatus Dormibacteraeota bacterium]|nr:Rieske 2Fe-2S domain-containing protein [Candidatus Dormibacteraeota bacterium]